MANTVVNKAKELRKLLEYVSDTLDDQTALTVATFTRRWKVDTAYAVDDRVSYKPNENAEVELWKCRQAHTSQIGWEPSTATASLWERIEEVHTGTIDDPIPYNINLTIYEGLYYTEDDVLYVCTRDSGQPLYASAASLIGNYFEVVTGHNVEPSGNEESGDEEPEGGEEPTEPEGGEPEGGEPEGGEPEVVIPEWTQPDAGNPYNIGDQVTFEGHVYESTINGNVWSPSAYPGGWTLVE